MKGQPLTDTPRIVTLRRMISLDRRKDSILSRFLFRMCDRNPRDGASTLVTWVTSTLTIGAHVVTGNYDTTSLPPKKITSTTRAATISTA